MARKDVNEIAYAVVQRAIGNAPKDTRTPYQKAAAEFGRTGGKRGGAERKKALSPKRRSLIAKRAAKARWSKA